MRKKLVSSSPYLQESKRKQKAILRKKILISISIFLAIFFALALLAHWSRLNIRAVEVSGNTVVDPTAIKQVAERNISGDYLWFFPKANFLIYPKAQIKTDLENEFKILKDLKVSLTGVNTLSISFSEREGKYTWCGNSLPDGETPQKCYFMDESGYIFGEAPYISGDVYLKFYGEVNKFSDIPLGSYYFPELFQKLTAFRKSTNGMGIKTSSYFVKDDGIELYLASNIPFPNKPKIVLKLDADVDKVAENLQTALSTEPLQTDFKKKFNSLESIDLRYGNKVYYKFK